MVCIVLTVVYSLRRSVRGVGMVLQPLLPDDVAVEHSVSFRQQIRMAWGAGWREPAATLERLLTLILEHMAVMPIYGLPASRLRYCFKAGQPIRKTCS